MSEWKFFTDDNIIEYNYPYWLIGVKTDGSGYPTVIKRGFMSNEGVFKSDEVYFFIKELGKKAVSVKELDFVVVAFMDNPEGLVGHFAPKPDGELIEKVQYLSKEIIRRNKENELRALPSLLDKINEDDAEVSTWARKFTEWL